MIIYCEVEGLPPLKGSDLSIWAKEEQIPRLAKLREAVKQHLDEHDQNGVFSKDIRLFLMVHMENLDRADLDNFISGICNGLMKAPDNAGIHEGWAQPEYEQVHPETYSAIKNDKYVVSISAEKVDGNADRYELILQGEVSPGEQAE